MGELKGGLCKIKLFGATIPVPENGEGGGDKDTPHTDTTSPESNQDQDDKQIDSETNSELRPTPKSDAPEPPMINKDDLSTNDSAPEEEESVDTDNSKEKALKKPDKILPCPRCNSMDTKFCYYNNYNVNQPRHFCKNCQRYWTAGGAMRNVPVGAGRRKSKNYATHYMQRIQSNGMEPICPQMKTNGTVLSFGADMPLCESMASSVDLADRMVNNCGRNGFNVPEKLVPMACMGKGDEQSIGSCVEGSNSKDEGKNGNVQDKAAAAAAQNYYQAAAANTVPFSCMNGAMWPYNWAPTPAYYNSSVAIPFYPAAAAAAAAYWGCMVPGAWSIPWPPPSPQAAASPNGVCSFSSGSSSHTLGKHSREGEVTKSSSSSVDEGGNANESTKDRCIWVPKTLRIDDPDEAARSSIWAMIGVKDGAPDNVSNGRKLSKMFEPKGDAKAQTTESSRLLHSNPAALSRSVTFHEGS